MQYDICLKTTSKAALISALAPFGLTSQDEDGSAVLQTASHYHALAYAGRVQATPAEIDNEGNVITEATYLPGEYAVLRADEALVKQLMAATLDGVEVLADAPAGCPTFGGWTPLPAGPSLEEVKAVRIMAATTLCDAVLAPLGREYGAYEMATWDQQYSEALAYKANPAAPVPLITALAQARGITSAALAAALLAAIGIDPIDLPRNSDLGTAAYLDQTWLYASATWDAPSCANAAQVSTAVAVPGAEIGDKVFPSASIALSGLNLRGEVTATDVVTLYLSNVTGSPVDLASATYYIAVLKRTPAR